MKRVYFISKTVNRDQVLKEARAAVANGDTVILHAHSAAEVCNDLCVIGLPKPDVSTS